MVGIVSGVRHMSSEKPEPLRNLQYDDFHAPLAVYAAISIAG
jgi:hypothetical protein